MTIMFNFLRVLRQPLFPCLASSERDSMSASGVCTQSISIVSFAVCSRQIDLGLLVLVFFFFTSIALWNFVENA